MKLLIVALVVGLITTALPFGAVRAADSPVAVAAPAATSPQLYPQRGVVTIPVLQRLLVVLDAGQSLDVLRERTMGKP